MSARTIETEVMLLDWSETAKGGAKIVLSLPSPDELEPFKAMTLAKRGVAGQRLVAVFALIDEGETPEAVPARADRGDMPASGQRLSNYAAMLGESEQFRRFLRARHRDEVEAFSVTHGTEWPAMTLRTLCSVTTRAAFDADPEAAKRFHALREEFRVWNAAQGGAR